MSLITRRQCVGLLPLAAVTVAARAQPVAPAQPVAAMHDSFPSQDPAMVREIVGVSHRDINRVRELLAIAPQLANAAYDWGFGDWETPLGAASHVGRREIAALLMEHGARPDVFTFAMLGHLDVIKAIIAANPGIQRLRGPHGITLAAHARAGGEPSKPVVEYLATLEGADEPYPSQPLTPEQQAVYAGEYAYGPGDTERLIVRVPERQNSLAVQRTGGSWRRLVYSGDHVFFPVGSPDVRLTFTVEGGRAVRVVITTPKQLVTAERS
jgi:hypothetical protein